MMTNRQPKVFLSHSSIDKQKVRKLLNIIESHKIECWLDEKNLFVGDPVQMKIEHALEHADFIVICFSRQALKSNWFNIEFRAALASQLQANKTKILPVIFDDSEPPLLFKDFLWADLSNANWNDGVKLLVETILTRFGDESILKDEFEKVTKSYAASEFHLFIISGLSSSGKDVLAYALEQRLNPKHHIMIAKKYTTRPRRPSESEYVRSLSEDEFTERLEKGTLLFPYPKRSHRYAFDTKQFNWAIRTGTPLITIFTDFIRVPRIVKEMQAREFATTAIFVQAKREHLLRRVLFRGMTSDEVVSRTKSIEQDLCEIVNRPTFKNEYLFLNNGDDRAFNEAAMELTKMVKKELNQSNK